MATHVWNPRWRVPWVTTQKYKEDDPIYTQLERLPNSGQEFIRYNALGYSFWKACYVDDRSPSNPWRYSKRTIPTYIHANRDQISPEMQQHNQFIQAAARMPKWNEQLRLQMNNIFTPENLYVIDAGFYYANSIYNTALDLQPWVFAKVEEYTMRKLG